jgi:hypothetical protein
VYSLHGIGIGLYCVCSVFVLYPLEYIYLVLVLCVTVQGPLPSGEHAITVIIIIICNETTAMITNFRDLVGNAN